jgi:aminoglycoside phosphotransferase (APT) family kinase protein
MNVRAFENYLTSLWPDLDIRSLTVIDAGWDSRVAEVNGEWIFRVPRGPYAVNAMMVEASLLPELAPHVPAPIPVFDYISTDPPCAGYRKIGGAPLDANLCSERVAVELGSFLRTLHSFPAERARTLGVPGGNGSDWRRRVVLECADWRRRVIPLLKGMEAARAARLLDDFVDNEANFNFEPALVHADLGPNHILCAGDRLAGVIDWGDVWMGDPAIDLAWSANRLPGPALSRLLQAYGDGADNGLLGRALFYYRIGPWHEVVYGLDGAGEDFVSNGLNGLRSRLPK